MKNKYILISIMCVYLIASFIQLTFDFTKWSIEARIFTGIPLIPMILLYAISNAINKMK